MRNTIIQGDCLEVLRTLPSDLVQCVISSPPYWGLRDYGTASWEGGDADCDHSTFKGKPRPDLTNPPSGWAERDATPTAGDCPKCGARRIDMQLGLEALHDCGGWASGTRCNLCHVCRMTEIFREVRRVLRPDGVMFLNYGDSYASGGRGGGADDCKQQTNTGSLLGSKTPPPGLKPKDLCGIPWRVALSLQADGWWLRSDIIWHKPNPMPESCTDRPTKSHEYLFLMTKSARYYWDAEAVKEKASEGTDLGLLRGKISAGGDDLISWKAKSIKERQAAGIDSRTAGSGSRNIRDVWTIATQPYADAHFATFPTKLVIPCIDAGSPPKCCGVCTAPWERIVEMTEEYKSLLASDKAWRDSSGKPDDFTNRQQKGHVSQVPQKNKTLGWRPTCEHNDDTGRSITLDPFMGSGTVAHVAKERGRDYLGIELNPEYIEMANRRLRQEVMDFKGVSS